MELYIDAVYESLHKYGEELCGDKVEFVRADDYFLAVLADGLGSGVKANILSTLTSKIIATMFASGAQLEETLETIASTLPVCSERGLAYSTFTIIKVGRDGKVYTAEFDNPDLLYFHRNQLTPIPRETVEIGGKTIHVSHFEAESSDMIITFSDGVVHAGVGRLLDLGWQYDNIVNYVVENLEPNMSPRVITKKLLAAVNTLYMQKCGDDSTVCALALKPSRPATVMVGPPVNGEMDKIVVDKLMYSRGLKVVCGGTTSQIVSRVTGRELKVQIDYENPAVPPIATLPGVDLVTEGVLTLGKALDIIKGINDAGADSLESYTLSKKDGASRITKLLLEDATEVRFLVGRALNPAHQNPGMPVSLGLKLNLIKELAAELERTGKKVTVEYF
ncbi:serine/threonine-protein phosphatase [Zongyangia hominis]|uniref:SpoIIE family protein phosphatase n=1 Tax=Zongyangia hominis TaxID=2763677 RepID=A0A926EAH7_9FIRM|nr:serine/threonine-protein phosphatase [Zongyangia hominis]MBC8569425.1 SpoIIE family protein phosphatase [Zongyangia hominis]